jgi:hypothetical protein
VIILGLSANHRVTPAEELDALPVKLSHGDRYPCRTEKKNLTNKINPYYNRF